MKRGIMRFDNCYLKNCATSVGKKENEGPLSRYFDLFDNDEYFGKDSWEKAEIEMASRCIDKLLEKSSLSYGDIDVLTGGDLLNQCVSSSFSAKKTGIPYVGLYGACSTAALALLTASVYIEHGFAEKAIAFASSHFCSAEKQYRFPLDYGGQRKPTSQCTVTGTGAFLLENKGDIKIKEGLIGIINDAGITDADNMGAAMAPAAVDTVSRYFSMTDSIPSDFDIIATGDLGREGYELANELFKKSGVDLCGRFTDCGMLIYDVDGQDTHSGGSGCGCSAVVAASLFYDKLLNGNAKDILLVGTGALLSQTTALQKQSIPAIAHLVRIGKE